MENNKCFFNFAVTLENYDSLLKLLRENDEINEENLRILRIYEAFLFELSICEINMLRGVLRDQHTKFITLMIQLEKAKTVIDELMVEVSKMAKAEKEKEEQNKQLTEEIHTEKRKRPSFFKNLKDGISKLFE